MPYVATCVTRENNLHQYVNMSGLMPGARSTIGCVKTSSLIKKITRGKYINFDRSLLNQFTKILGRIKNSHITRNCETNWPPVYYS